MSLRPPDWTIALDDALVERFAKCLLCLGPAQSIHTFVVSGLVLAVSRCHKCCRADPQGTRVLAQLAQREQAAVRE